MRVPFRLLRFILGHELAGRHRAAALGRLLRWQVGGRLGGLPMVVPLVGPTRLVLRRGLSSATAAWYVGLTDFREMGFCLHLLRPGDLMGDIGANIGVYAVLAAGVSGAGVVAVEPAAATLPHLHDNIRLNDLSGRISVLPVAMGEAPGRLRISAGRGAANRVLRAGEAEAAEEVAVTTLDAAFAGRTPMLLKLDVEGFEARILAGGARILADPALRAVIVETAGHASRYGEGPDAPLRRHGFAPFDYDPRLRALTPRAGPGAPNTLYLRDAGFCALRVAAAPPFEVFGERF
ncbi:FkbM family methyltransferase [Falsiroseomonas sp. E2-1-a20]|uniref:FkbM family methyltransferase n=1 Tax=Falsiroseomonas sp. E2-1-a20 TaxID=3239300 RepID=UPI003F3F74B0